VGGNWGVGRPVYHQSVSCMWVVGVLPMPMLSPCSGLVMVLGAGAAFGIGFMSVAEVIVIAGTRTGRSCSANCGRLHPSTWAWQSRAQVSGFHRGLWRPIP